MEPNRLKLESLTLSGYKSFSSDDHTIKFGGITVLIGPNGAGKSNLISFFRLLNYMTTGALQTHIAGSADALLYFGPKRTRAIGARLRFSSETKKDEYNLWLSYSEGGNTLVITDEGFEYHKSGLFPGKMSFPAGRLESGLTDPSNVSDARVRFVHALLSGCRCYHFHDTSSEARIRGDSYIDDNRYLRNDAGNLAAFLYSIKKTKPKHYERIIRHISRVVPQFADFELEPRKLDEKKIRLNWHNHTSDYLFGAHQLSDGSLRFAALTTLFLQPEPLPSVIILDEPELGLHPSALTELAGVIRTASEQCQVIIATQSPRLIDEFNGSDLVVLEWDREKRTSVFRELDESQLLDWMKDYSLGDLWEKNVLGGKP